MKVTSWIRIFPHFGYAQMDRHFSHMYTHAWTGILVTTVLYAKYELLLLRVLRLFRKATEK